MTNMELILGLMVVILILIVPLAYAKGKTVIYKDFNKKYSTLVMLDNISNTDLAIGIHPLVKEVYKMFINNSTMFKVGHCTVDIVGFDRMFSIWAENDINNRTFYWLPIGIINEYGEKEDINNQLNSIDRLILDTICTRIKTLNKEFINKAFIK